MYNLDFRKIFVLLVLIITFIWLMMPNKEPHHKATEKPSGQNGEVLALRKMMDDMEGTHRKQLRKKDETIDFLKNEKKKSDKEEMEKNEQLENQIKKLSKVAEDKDRLYKELLEKMKKIETQSNSENKGVPFKGLKIVHLDLKGAPPKISYLIDFMKLAKKFGANGFLIEYEDMFPWSGDLKILAHEKAYSKEDLARVLNFANEEGLEVVPLIQTFGHLEFVLKHKQFAHLQAVKRVSTSICPLNNQSLPLIKKLVDQILNLHPKSKWIHLGGDEVWNIKNCDRCQGANYTDTELYHRHMLPIIKYVKTKKTTDSNSITAIIWDDMMRHWKVDDLKLMAKHVIPMVWGYVDDLENYPKFPKGMWKLYMEAFPKIWFASSFKGALKPWSNFVPIKQHLNNHISWLKIYKKYQESNKEVTGIALTGWSRFDHFGPLCELLPVGVPSLALCLNILKEGIYSEKIHTETSNTLGFEHPFKTVIKRFTKYEPEHATFPGHKIYQMVGAIEKAVGYKGYSDHVVEGWMRPYFIEKEHLSFFQLNSTISNNRKSKELITKIETSIESNLKELYEDYVVDEWMKDKIKYFKDDIDKTIERIQPLLERFHG